MLCAAAGVLYYYYHLYYYYQVHQWFHVVLGPCTSLCNNPPRCDSNHCELLIPLHAGYDMLARARSVSS